MHHAPRYGIYQEKRTAQDATAAAVTVAAANTTTTGLAGTAAASLMSLLSIIKRDRNGNWKQ